MISTLVAATFAVALSGQPMAVSNTPEQAPAAAPAARATNADIEDALWKLLETDPERVVCTEQMITGSRQPRAVCGSVKRWFNARTPTEKATRQPPWQLVEEITKNRKKAEAAGRAAR